MLKVSRFLPRQRYFFVLFFASLDKVIGRNFIEAFESFKALFDDATTLAYRVAKKPVDDAGLRVLVCAKRHHHQPSAPEELAKEKRARTELYLHKLLACRAKRVLMTLRDLLFVSFFECEPSSGYTHSLATPTREAQNEIRFAYFDTNLIFNLNNTKKARLARVDLILKLNVNGNSQTERRLKKYDWCGSLSKQSPCDV